MSFVWFTNAHIDHYGKPIAVNRNHVFSTFTAERKRNEQDETVTVLFAGSEGAWEVQESLEEAVARLNTNG